MSSRSISSVRSANAPVPGGPATGSGDGAMDIAHRMVTRSLKSVTWSECRCVSSTWCRNGGPGMPAAARRMATPRPQSTSRLQPARLHQRGGPSTLGVGKWRAGAEQRDDHRWSPRSARSAVGPWSPPNCICMTTARCVPAPGSPSHRVRCRSATGTAPLRPGGHQMTVRRSTVAIAAVLAARAVRRRVRRRGRVGRGLDDHDRGDHHDRGRGPDDPRVQRRRLRRARHRRGGAGTRASCPTPR